MESRTIFCGTLLTRREAEEEEARGGEGWRGRDRVEGAPLRESTRTQGGGVGSAEREARRKKGGCGVAEALEVVAAIRLLTGDVERSAICLVVRMISSSDEARRRFFAAPVGAAAAASPSKRSFAYTLDRLEGAVAVGAAR